MILTCPACATSYFVPDTAIGPNGRRVRCKSCSHDWRVTTDDIPLDLGEVAAAIAPATQSAEPEPEVPSTPAPLPQAFRARAEEKRRARKAMRQGMAVALLLIVVMAVLGSGYLMRDTIVAKVPALAGAYKTLGIKTNPVGLEFEAESARFVAHDTRRVIISGAVRNIRDREIVMPPIRISMRDASGREFHHHIYRADTAPVLPGQVEGFAVILPNADGQFAYADMTFMPEDARPAPKPAQAPTRREVPAPSSSAAPEPVTKDSSVPKTELPRPAAAASTPKVEVAPAISAAEGNKEALPRISDLGFTPSPLDIIPHTGVSA